MDIHLLKKDMVLIRKRFVVLFALGLVIFAILEYQVRDSSVRWLPLPLLSCLFTYMLVGMVYEKEERNQASCLLISAAYHRHDIMRCRFVFLVGLEVAFLLCCTVINGFLCRWSAGALLLSAGIGVLAGALPLALMTPVLARFEYAKAQNAIMVVFLSLVMVFTLGTRASEDMMTVLGRLESLNAGIIFGGAVGTGAVLLILSCGISVRLFEQREFY